MNFEKLTNFLENLENRFGIRGGDLIVKKDGKTVYRHFFGTSDKDGNRKVQGNEIYRIYSCSKVITCTAVMKLIEQGKLGLYDNLSKYIPEFSEMYIAKENKKVKAENQIRIIDLMQMCAGMVYGCNNPVLVAYKQKTEGKCDTLGTVKEMAKMSLSFEPGTQYQYSFCHDVLGGVIEVVTGQKLSDYMKENFFVPLNMTETDYKYTSGNEERRFWRARYFPESNSTVPLEHDINVFELGREYESGGAGVITTVDDYIKFAAMLCNGGVTENGERLISFESIDLMRKTFNEKATAFAQKGYKYCLGVRSHIGDTDGVSKSGEYEFGWDGAFGAYTEIDIENGIAVFFGCGTSCINVLVHPEMRNIIHECIEL